MLRLRRGKLRDSVECEITIPISHLTYPINPIEHSKLRISENTFSNVYILFKCRNKIWIDHLLSAANLLTPLSFCWDLFVCTLVGVPDCALLQKGLALSFLHLLLNSTWKGFDLQNETLQVVYFLQSEHIFSFEKYIFFIVMPTSLFLSYPKLISLD